ncbi:carbohydrate ABC transporter permease [Jatrophihabitans sp. YIM 134969]
MVATAPPDTRTDPSGAPSPALLKKIARRGQWRRRAPLLPALVFMIVVTQLPFVFTLIFSFFDWNSYRPSERHFNGIDNYKRVFTDSTLRDSVLQTILMTFVVVVVSVILGFAIALLLDRKFFGRGAVRTLMIAPFLVVPVAAALLFKHGTYNPSYGLFNGVLTWIWDLFGATAPQPDIIGGHPTIAVEAALIWQWTPFMMLILLAGLQSRDPEIIEAAKVDGAGGWAIFKAITLPHMRQYLELGALLGSIYIVQNFDAVFTITSGGGGTANLPYTIYRTFYQGHEYGLASAQGVVVVVASLILATFALRTVSSLFKES